MPRPKLEKEKYRGKKVVVRFNEEEYKKLLLLAKEEKLTISKLIRKIKL